MSQLQELRKELKKYATPEKAKASAWFFKTGPGQYGEGDVFIGVTVPEQRKVGKLFRNIALPDAEELLSSSIHEERLVALFILVDQFKKADSKTQAEIYNFYLKNTKKINNWDLVDSSAGYIVGEYLIERSRDVLYELALSENLWEKRIAIISTFAFIRRGQFKDTFKIAEILLSDKHDLIHKAVGWMMREVGNNGGQEELEKFLKKHYKKMPRTMLRYAIEKFPERLRVLYLRGQI